MFQGLTRIAPAPAGAWHCRAPPQLWDLSLSKKPIPVRNLGHKRDCQLRRARNLGQTEHAANSTYLGEPKGSTGFNCKLTQRLRRARKLGEYEHAGVVALAGHVLVGHCKKGPRKKQ